MYRSLHIIHRTVTSKHQQQPQQPNVCLLRKQIVRGFSSKGHERIVWIAHTHTLTHTRIAQCYWNWKRGGGGGGERQRRARGESVGAWTISFHSFFLTFFCSITRFQWKQYVYIEKCLNGMDVNERELEATNWKVHLIQWIWTRKVKYLQLI